MADNWWDRDEDEEEEGGLSLLKKLRRNAHSSTGVSDYIETKTEPIRRQKAEEEQQRKEYEQWVEANQYGPYGDERDRAGAGPNALTPEMEYRRQAASGGGNRLTPYQVAMQAATAATPPTPETRSTDELRRDMNRQNRIARGTERMTADMGGQMLRDQSLLFNPTYTSNLRTMGQTMEAQQNKAAAATNHYQTLSVQRREQEEREKYAALMSNPDFVAKSQGDSTIGNKTSSTSLAPAERLYQKIFHRNDTKDANGNIKDAAGSDAARFVNDEEAAIFYYLWNTQGAKAAQSYYYGYVENRAGERRAQLAQQQAQAYGEYDPVGASIARVGYNAMSGIGLVDMALQNLTRALGITDRNKPLNYNSDAQLPGQVADALQSGASNFVEQFAADEIKRINPNVKHPENYAKVASFLYQTGMSMADSNVAIALNLMGIPEPLTLANMGASAGTRAIREARERGATDGQALAFGISSAIMEALFEKLSLDSILKESNAHNLAQSILGTLKQGFTESSEEVMTTLANTAADMFIMGDKAEVFAMQRRLMEQGVSEREALKAALTQWGTGILGDAIGGFISGAGMGGVKEFSSARNNPLYQWNMPMAEARALQNIEQNGLPQERGITPEMQASIDAAMRAQNEREIAQDRETLEQLRNAPPRLRIAEDRRNAAAAPPLPQQAGQITPESVTTPPVPGNAQRGAESAERAGERIATAPAGPRNDGGRETGDPLISPSGTASPRGSQEAGAESQTLGNSPVPGARLYETGGNNSGENRLRIPENPQNVRNSGDNSQEAGLRIPAREQTENRESGSGLRIVGANRQQQKTAQQRQLQEEGNRAESLRDRGFRNAGAGETVYVRSEERWDAEERAVAAALRENGIEPTFVTGLLQDADGKRVTSLMDGEKLAIQADNRSQTVQSIAEQATGLTLNAAGDTLNENRNGGLRIGRQTENSPAAEAGGGDGRGTALPSEERQRFSGQRAGEQAGGLGQGAEKGQPVFGQVRKASSRRSYAEAHGKVTVYNRGSGKSLGIRAAAESSKSQIASEKQVQEDEELRSISEAFKQATGLPVSFTFGTVQLANGREARGVYTGKRFVVQCDDDTYTASQLALHELYHYFADKNPGLNAKLKERILKANKGQALDEVMQTYINELGPAAGLSENMSKKAYDKAIDKILEEVFADAYAGINDYGARAGQFNEEARQTERDFRSSENAAATAQRTGPPKQKSTASLKKDLRDKLLSTFHTPDGYKQYLGNMVGEYADRILENGRLTEEEATALFDALYEEGSVKTAADEVFQEARKEVRGAKIYVPESIKHEFSDDWRDFQRRAFGQGVLLTNNPADMAIDEYHAAISAEYPGVFDPDETDMRTILETIVNVADSGKGKTVSLRDYGTSIDAYLQDGWAYDSREEQQAELRKAMEEALQEFADQAGRESFSFAGRSSAEQQKIGAGMTDAEREKILRAKESFTAAEYQGQADKLILNQSEALNSRKHKLVKAAVRQAAEEFGMPTELFNSDMELEAYISKGTLDESVDKQIMNAGQLVRLIPVLSDAVNNAVGIEAHDNRYFADYNTLYFANLLGGYIDGDSFIPVRFGIKAAKDGKNTLYVVISDQKINKAEVIAPPNPDNAVKNGPRSASEINIAKLAQLVNHSDIIKYIPDGMLTEELRSQKWKAIAATVAYTNEKNDRKYKQFIEKGDLANAQRMVDEAAKAAGYTIHAYHGTGRADRVGNVFRADRATSGPMAFFTDSKDIAENYSRDKRDTSLAYDTDYDSYETQFRAKHTKTGKDFAIYKMWGYIPLSERAKIKEKARHVRANWEGEGEIIYDPQATEANGGWSHQLQEFKGDVLKALNEQWLNSGNLFNEEEQYLKVLELAGVTDALKKAGFEMPRYMNPDYREEAVYDVFLKIQNPFDATSMIDEDFIQGFEDFAVDNEERFTKESVDADYWDKNSVSAEEFAERMRNDLERGVTHAWTSIPDVMSEYLKSLGYDGIKDAGGKNGGQGHTVWIPFTSEQIKRTDPITYDDAGNIIPLSERFNPINQDIRFSLKGQTEAAAQEARTLGSREVLDTPALKKLGVKVSGSVGDYGKTESLIAKDRAAKSLQKEARRAEKRLRATDAEKEFANGITAGIYREEDIPKRLNKDTVMELADYYWAMNSANLQTLHQLRADINAGLRDEAEGFLAEADIKPISMIELNERTPERAFRKMFGEKAQGITKWLLDPVRENEAEKIRWYNQQMDAVRKFTDSKGKSRELTRAESALTMKVMEGQAAAKMVAGMETKAAIENAAANIRKGGDAADAAREFSLSSEERDLAEKYAGWLDTQEELKTADSTIVEAAAKKYAELFDDYYGAINDFLVAHGYEPIGYIKGYAPHMQPEENQSLLEKAFEKMGINAAVTELPASIAGQTTFFKPNKRWNPYFLQRNGSEANYDIVKAYQSYVDYMADILYHTDDIMRVRQTANWIRQTYAPEEIRQQLEWARELRQAPMEDKQRLLRDAGEIGQSTVLSAVDTAKAMQEYTDKLYERISNSTKNSNLVMWLDNYANILAGKQSFADRGWEYSTGRKSLNLANKLNNAFQKANVAGNLSSILNQTAQLPMIYAELGERDFTKAIFDLATGKTKAWAQDSDFLTAKEGKELLYTDNADKFISALFAPAGFMDSIVSTVAVRGAFNKAIRQGASYAEAMQRADAFGQAVMGSRAKGSRPLAYESKGFFSKMVHMFQIEAVNSWDHLVSDLPREIRSIAKKDGKGKAAMALAGLILRALIGAFTLNRLTDELYGGTPAPFDVLGLTANFVASGKGLNTNAFIRTIIDNTMEKMGQERLFGTEAMTKEDFDLEAASKELLYNALNDVPLVRNAAGVLGWGDQTLPLPGAGGEFKNLGTAVKNMLKEGVEPGEIENLLKAMGLAATQFIPGGRQISKTAQGAEAIIRGGSYNGYKKPKLQYPLEGATDLVKALLFGKNATNAAKEYWAAGGNALTEKQTALYTSLASHGVGRKEAYDAIQEYRRIANDDSLTSYERGKAERALLAGLGISDEDKLDMYRELNNAESKAAKFRAIMETGLSFDRVMAIQDKYAEIDGKEGLKAGDKAKEFYLWVDNQSYTANQKTEIKNQLKYFQSIPAEAARYDKLTASGLSPDMSAKIDQAIGKLEPEAGKTDVSDYQKWRAAMAAVSGEANQEKALQALMTEEQYAKYQKTGVSPTAYVNYKAAVSQLVPLPGQEGITNAQKWNAALKSLGTSASKKDKLALVGDIVGTEKTTKTGEPTQWAKINRVVDSGKSVEDTMKMVEDGKLDVYVRWMDSDAKAAGVKSDTYLAWRETYANTNSTRDENGKEVKGQKKKDKILAYIDGLNLTREQKDALFLEEYKESGLSDTPWHKGGGKGSGSYAMARTPALRIPEAPRAEKPSSGLRIRGTQLSEARQTSGLRIRGTTEAPARQTSGLRIRDSAPAAQAPRSGLRIRAK